MHNILYAVGNIGGRRVKVKEESAALQDLSDFENSSRLGRTESD